MTFSVGGVATLAAGVNVTAAALAAATIVIYGLIYTPLKRRTRWATEVGSRYPVRCLRCWAMPPPVISGRVPDWC